MNPPVFAALNVSAVNAFVGGRIFQTRANQDTTRPYIVWQIVGGGPDNNLSCDPEFDDARVRVWCYTPDTAGSAAARNLALAARDALEAVTHVIFGPIDDYESDTKLYVWIMDAEFFDNR